MVCALRPATDFAHDDLTFAVARFLPHLNRHSIWRILRAQVLSRRPPPSPNRPKRGQGKFKDYDLGLISASMLATGSPASATKRAHIVRRWPSRREDSQTIGSAERSSSKRSLK